MAAIASHRISLCPVHKSGRPETRRLSESHQGSDKVAQMIYLTHRTRYLILPTIASGRPMTRSWIHQISDSTFHHCLPLPHPPSPLPLSPPSSSPLLPPSPITICLAQQNCQVYIARHLRYQIRAVTAASANVAVYTVQLSRKVII